MARDRHTVIKFQISYAYNNEISLFSSGITNLWIEKWQQKIQFSLLFAH